MVRVCWVVVAMVLGLGLASPARGQTWGVTEAKAMCAPVAQGQFSGGQAAAEAALRIALHPHTPATINPTARADADGTDIVFNFSIQWTTSMLNTNCTTVIVARINREGFQSATVQQDSSGKVGQGNTERMTSFLRDVLWPFCNGSARVQRLRRSIDQTVARSVFNAGFSVVPYRELVFSGTGADGNDLIIFVTFWEKGLTKANQNTVIRWRVGKEGHVGVATDSTSDPKNAAGMESILRDTIWPQVRGR